MDSYSKRYPLRNTSPPIPDTTQNHGEHLFGSWFKHSIEDGNKVFYYNSKTHERTWSIPKRRVVDVCYIPNNNVILNYYFKYIYIFILLKFGLIILGRQNQSP